MSLPAWMSQELLFFVRLLLACICGGAIGIERTLRQKEAGFRTHVIVALGSALMMIISKYGFRDVVGNGITSDAGRIAANIITGISFLGAGMIFVRGATIKGLTTAAGIWVTAAVGMAIGCGMYFTGIAGTVLVILVQIVFHTFLIGFDKVLANDNTSALLVRMKSDPEAVSNLQKQLSERKVEVLSAKINNDAEDTVTLCLTVRYQNKGALTALNDMMRENASILTISLE